MAKKHRSPNKPVPVTADRKLVSRVEARAILGCSIDTIKRMEKRRGGLLDVVKLRGAQSTTFYRLDQIKTLIDPTTTQAAE